MNAATDILTKNVVKNDFVKIEEVSVNLEKGGGVGNVKTFLKKRLLCLGSIFWGSIFFVIFFFLSPLTIHNVYAEDFESNKSGGWFDNIWNLSNNPSGENDNAVIKNGHNVNLNLGVYQDFVFYINEQKLESGAN
jgi:hypothetical protein